MFHYKEFVSGKARDRRFLMERGQIAVLPLIEVLVYPAARISYAHANRERPA